MQPMPLRVGVLGPLIATRGDLAVTPGSPMLRCLLGLLAVQPHRVVSRDEIVDTLWGEDPPKTCLASVHVYIGRLRDLLEPERERRSAGLLSASANGYVLTPERDQLDLLQFEDLAADGLLADALALWRGPVLAGLSPRLDRHPTAAAATSRRIAVALVYADEALRHGNARAAVAPLQAVAHDESLHEGVHARLVLALAASGQQAAALALVADMRERLADELGVDPGPELTDAHLRVLRQDVPAQPIAAATAHATPRQLPADVRSFVGRTDVLTQLDDALLGEAGDADGAHVVTLTGTAGVGKSALAVHWAHRVRERFPDGQLFLNLRGYSPTPPLRPIDALAQLLRALGVPADQVPIDVDEAAGMYRSLLTDRRVLLLIDNAHSPDQVRPLLPGGSGCRTLVTSRDQLLGLAALDGAHPISIDVLSPAEAHALLTRTIGGDRVAAEQGAAARLARACAYLPLALRIAAANLAGQPRLPIGTYLQRLRADDRLAELTVAGDAQAAVRAAFDLSYRALPATAQRLFRLLGSAPGADISLAAAAALVGMTPDEAHRHFDVLVAAHLATEPSPGRYALHDLLRLYAAERSRAEDNEHGRRDAVSQLYDWYAAEVDRAAAVVYPERVRLPFARQAEPAPIESADALNWLDAERPNLLAAVVHAHEHGQGARAPMLADALRGHFAQRATILDWLALAGAARAAAEAADDPAGLSAAHLSLAEVRWRQSDHAAAIEHYRQAVTLSRAAGWVAGEAAALGNLGAACRSAGRVMEAVGYLEQSLELNRSNGIAFGEAARLGGLGAARHELGEFEVAVARFTEALDLYRQAGSVTGEGIALNNLGEAYYALGRYEEAADCFERSVPLFDGLGALGQSAMARRGLALVRSATGTPKEALELAQQALSAGTEIAERRVEALSLLALGGAHELIGDRGAADECRRTALRFARESGNRYAEAMALVELAEAARIRGDQQTAASHGRKAAEIADECGFRWFAERAAQAMDGQSAAS